MDAGLSLATFESLDLSQTLACFRRVNLRQEREDTWNYNLFALIHNAAGYKPPIRLMGGEGDQGSRPWTKEAQRTHQLHMLQKFRSYEGGQRKAGVSPIQVTPEVRARREEMYREAVKNADEARELEIEARGQVRQ